MHCCSAVECRNQVEAVSCRLRLSRQLPLSPGSLALAGCLFAITWQPWYDPLVPAACSAPVVCRPQPRFDLLAASGISQTHSTIDGDAGHPRELLDHPGHFKVTLKSIL